MKRLVIVAMLILTSVAQGFAMDSLAEYVWRHRILLIFGNDTDVRLRKQTEILEGQSSELADRDMVVLRIAGDTVDTLFGEPRDFDASRLRMEANVTGDQFQVVLIGKDGGIKLKSTDEVANLELFDLIDRMPMRKTEKDD